MSRFLFTTLPTNDLGLLARSLPIARELSDKGHEIVFCSPGKAPRVLIAEAGFEDLRPKHPIYELGSAKLTPGGLFRLLRSNRVKDEYGGAFRFLWKLARATPVRFARSSPETWSMDHLAAMAGLMNANFVRANCDAMMRLIEDLDPDAVVDFWNPFACIAARALRKPLVTVIQADAHPSGKGFIWWRDPPDGIPSAVPATNKVLAGYGLESISKLDELNVGDLTLIVGTPQTDPVPDGTGCTYIGPILWQNPDAALPDWFEELDEARPVIWVYSGNPRYGSRRGAWDSEIVLEACVEGLAGLDAQVVLTTGHHALPQEYEPLPENFRFARYVPGLTMAERSDLMIHHGGYGSCQTGLFSGTPAVIIPTFAERESNARRITSLGAGELVLPTAGKGRRKRIDLDEFQAKVRRVLTDPGYTKRAEHYGEILKLYGGAKEAARLIEDVANRRPRFGLPAREPRATRH